MVAADLIEREYRPVSADLAPAQTWQVIAGALGRIGFHVPEGYGEEQGGVPDIAPLMNFDTRSALAERVKLITPDCFKGQETSGNVERVLSEAKNSETVRKAFGKISLQPEDIGVGRALWTPSQEGSIFTRLQRSPASVARGQIGETLGIFGLRYLLPDRSFGDRVAYARELVKSGLATKDRSGKIWVPTPGNMQTIEHSPGHPIDRKEYIASTPVTATPELRIMSRLARMIAGDDQSRANDPKGYETTNEFVCLVSKDKEPIPVAVTSVGWSVGHGALSLTCRGIG